MNNLWLKKKKIGLFSSNHIEEGFGYATLVIHGQTFAKFIFAKPRCF